MWKIFWFYEKDNWDKPNIRIDYIWEQKWPNVAIFNQEIIELTDFIANNLKSILESKQFCLPYDIENWIQTRWLFSDCHSFALLLWAGVSDTSQWPLRKDFLESIWFKQIWIYDFSNWTDIELRQWDIIISNIICGQHSVMFLEKQNNNTDIWIDCSWWYWYTNKRWKYFQDCFTKLNIFKLDKILRWWNIEKRYYIKKWYRLWWRIRIWEISKMFWLSKWHWAKDAEIYRKI